MLTMFLLTIIQNGSFTLVSRARNSGSILYHGIAATLSNGIWLLVIRKVVASFDSIETQLSYLAGAVVGSILMHYVSMRFIEKGKRAVGGKS
jgi:uncharacterized membrane-anchored protein